eukprot:569860-Rhodomonas_salina.2
MVLLLSEGPEKGPEGARRSENVPEGRRRSQKVAERARGFRTWQPRHEPPHFAAKSNGKSLRPWYKLYARCA